VAEPWSPPKAFSDVSVALCNTILNDFARGLDNGQRYSNAPAAANERQAWLVIRNHCANKPETQCRQIINAWLNSGLLYPKDYLDPVQRKQRSGLFVNDAKRPS
jgi:hypothetical protein